MPPPIADCAQGMRRPGAKQSGPDGLLLWSSTSHFGPVSAILNGRVTDPRGRHWRPVPGKSSLQVTAQGCSTTEMRGVGNTLGCTQAAPVESSQSTQGTMRPTEVAELPILNRTTASIMTLIARAGGAAPTVSLHGARRRHSRTLVTPRLRRIQSQRRCERSCPPGYVYLGSPARVQTTCLSLKRLSGESKRNVSPAAGKR